MTAPLQQPDKDARVNWLIRYLGVQQVYDKQITKALQQAYVDAGDAADKWQGMNIADRTKRYQVKLVQREISGILKAMFKDLVPVISKGQSDAAEAAAKAALAKDAKVLDALFPDAASRKAWEASFQQSARHGIQAMITRVLHTNLPLSKQVYKTYALESGRIDRKINSALARGASAQELAKLVRNDIKPSVAGGVSYAALRLGRTEINNAFHAMSIEAAQDFPWTESVEWNLSKVHEPQGCVCERYALQREFPVDNVPAKPHPQCMCFVVPKTMDWNSFQVHLLDGDFDSFFERSYGTQAA